MNDCFGESFTSDAFSPEHEKIQQLSCNDSYPRAIAALMFWSDSTHPAQFGQARLWPLYLYFGDQSKYERGVDRHRRVRTIVAYFPAVRSLSFFTEGLPNRISQLPDDIKDFVLAESSTNATLRPAALAHCRRELMHEAWKKLLDPELVLAYVHGTVVQCADGITRRIFPYSAGCPEKWV